MASTDFYTTSHDEAGRVAWNGCFTPNKKDDGTDQYNLKLLFPKTAPVVAKLKAMASQCKVEAFGANPGGKIESPFQDGDLKYQENPEKFAAYKGMVVVSFKTKFAPRVFGADLCEINATNQHVFTPGCYVSVHCNAFSWTFGNMKKGVSMGFDAVQKLRDAGPNEPVINAGGGIQTAEQAGFTPAAANDPANYAPPATGGDEPW